MKIPYSQSVPIQYKMCMSIARKLNPIQFSFVTKTTLTGIRLALPLGNMFCV